uniref:Reverse transcriptase domain-containing protein n=1 Tax=Tanacetum cinerariifolium TaxID=118510 RepID=A0A6L2KW66_TANCI|nr:hypothetical protein [Tanacetum cinerariifolium]
MAYEFFWIRRIAVFSSWMSCEVRARMRRIFLLDTTIEAMVFEFVKVLDTAYASKMIRRIDVSKGKGETRIKDGSTRHVTKSYKLIKLTMEEWGVWKKRQRVNQMHNNIMAAGSRDRPLMLAKGRYLQWRSQFLRYIDTRPNGDALRKCILNGPYIPTTVVVQDVAATDDSPIVLEHTIVETPMNMSPENKAHFESKKEAIHLILTGIGDEIYSTLGSYRKVTTR